MNILYIATLMCFVLRAEAGTVYVSPQGDDSFAGTAAKPFATLNRAVSGLNAGDTCIIGGGVYRESVTLNKSGTPEQPITLKAHLKELVVIDGCDPLELDWKRSRGNIYVAKCPDEITQLFSGKNLLSEARWPNMNRQQQWDEEKRYARTGKGSAIGSIIHDGLATSGLDLSGCRINVRIGKGQCLTTRDVTEHTAGSREIKYDVTALQIPTARHFLREDLDPSKIKRFGLHNNRFYLEGGISLVDTEGEWAWDSKKKELYFYAPAGVHPSKTKLYFKKRKIGMSAVKRSHIRVQGITFRGCAINFEACSDCEVDSIRSFHPTQQQYFSTLADREKKPDAQAGAVNLFSGSRISVRNSLFAYALKDGVVLDGSEMVLENSVIHDADLIGEHGYAGLKMVSSSKTNPCIVRNNTIYNCGAVGIRMHRYATQCAYNEVFNTGMFCHDVSAFYLPIYGDGSVISHNWSHDNSGMAYRVDNAGKDITFHHNVAWNNGSGVKLQGVDFNVFNNTILDEQPTSSMMFVVEPRKGDPVPEFLGSKVKNNIGYFFNIRDRAKGWIPITNSNDVSNNIRLTPSVKSLSDLNGRFRTRMTGWDNFERVKPDQVFKSVPSGELDIVPLKGTAGAYEPAGEFWVPGASWLPDGLKKPKTVQQATKLAENLGKTKNKGAPALDERVKSNL